MRVDVSDSIATGFPGMPLPKETAGRNRFAFKQISETTEAPDELLLQGYAEVIATHLPCSFDAMRVPSGMLARDSPR